MNISRTGDRAQWYELTVCKDLVLIPCTTDLSIFIEYVNK